MTDITTELIEKAARAIWEYRYPGIRWEYVKLRSAPHWMPLPEPPGAKAE